MRIKHTHQSDVTEADGCEILSESSKEMSRQLFSICDSYEEKMERNKKESE